MVALPARRLWTAAEFERMAEVGLLSEDDRLELIDGEIIEMTPIGPRHMACTDRLNSLLSRRLGKLAIIRVQGPILLGVRSEPQPDVVVLRLQADYYAEGHPLPDAVYLVIEVADTSVEYDRTVKIPRYAQVGIREVWLVDLNRSVIVVYRDAREGEYHDIQEFRRGQRIRLLAFPRTTLRVNEILG